MTTTRIFTTTQRNRIRAHANNNIFKILDALNITYNSRSDLIQARCPCKQHSGNGDNATAFSWRKHIGHWRCWTHHCEDLYGSDIFGLVRSILDISFNQTVEWIYNTLVNSQVDLKSDVSTSYQNNRMPAIKIHEPLNESCLRFLSVNDDFLLRRNFKPTTLRKYEIGFWSRLGTFMHNRLIFPIRDAQGILVGFTGRTIYEEALWPKFHVKAKWVHGRYFDRWPQQDELQTGSILYNLFRAKNHIGESKSLILVEGPLDGLRLDEAGIYNWVALLSCSFGYLHRTLLINYGINELVLALDTDEAGREASDKIAEEAKEFFHIQRPQLPIDPGKCSIQQLKEVFSVN